MQCIQDRVFSRSVPHGREEKVKLANLTKSVYPFTLNFSALVRDVRLAFLPDRQFPSVLTPNQSTCST